MDILREAEAILGPAVSIDQRNWATFWCPFHGDQLRAGRAGRPNLGVNLEVGFWKCMRCGASGHDLQALRNKLGDPTPKPAALRPPPLVPKPPTGRLLEALTLCRVALNGSPALDYLRGRGVGAFSRLTYGLGVGVPFPDVHLETFQAARDSRLVGQDGAWLWSEGIVYADPPNTPQVLQVRHLRAESPKKYQTWGRYTTPLGAWRIQPRTRALVMVEGMFDMLVMAQRLHEAHLDGNVIALYTGGAAPSRLQLNWLLERAAQYDFILIPDPDEAGKIWTHSIASVLRKGHGRCRVDSTPRGLDPDEALLAGWWPRSL